MSTGNDSDDVKGVLGAVCAKAGGTMTPDDVLCEASKKDSVLHKHFDWDADEAARKFQARELIMSQTVTLGVRELRAGDVA